MTKRYRRVLASLAAAYLWCLGTGTAAATPALNVLASLTQSTGTAPYGGVVLGPAGNLYGVASRGGSLNGGTVFKVIHRNTTWTLRVLASLGGAMGSTPVFHLTRKPGGNLFGTASGGGSSSSGTVFEVTPPVTGQTTWTFKLLDSCTSRTCADANGGVVADKKGNFYGTSYNGGSSGLGSVFQLAPPGSGQTSWTLSTLLSFTGANGSHPSNGLLIDRVGNLYGTTTGGGSEKNGTVFKLAPPVAGQTHWTETVLTAFAGLTAKYPFDGLAMDKAHNLYGTTSAGGTADVGVIFELVRPTAKGTAWTTSVLFSFTGANGATPYDGVAIDDAGNLYGTTSGGGSSGNGVVFKLAPPTNGSTNWTESVLASFTGTNGSYPVAGISLDKSGNLYGTTVGGGASGLGTVFEVTQ